MAGPVTVVVDASVAVKWIIKEDGSPEALAFLARPQRLAAPDIVIIEGAAALSKRVHIGALEKNDADARLARLRQLIEQAPVELVSATGMLEAAFNLSSALRHPFVDCLYLALAQSLGGALATADRRLADAAVRAGLANILRLGPAAV